MKNEIDIYIKVYKKWYNNLMLSDKKRMIILTIIEDLENLKELAKLDEVENQ